MKISAIEARARTIANVGATATIDHSFVDDSVNEVWKEVYARLIDLDDDYWTKTETFSTLSTYATTNPNEYKITLPTDFYRLRFVDWSPASTGGWKQMHKFALSLRNEQLSEPQYRFDGDFLWVVGANVSQVRITYYPPPDTLTHPDLDLQYATAVTPNNFALISSPVYASWKNTGVYIYNAQNIAEGSIDDNTVGTPITLLAAGANLSNLVYYKGYLYWLQGGNIKRAPTDLVTTPIVPANVIATTTVTSFAIFQDLIYYTDAGSMKHCTLAGATVTLILAAAGTSLCLAGGIVYYVDGSNNLKSASPVATLLANVSACSSDGTYLYALDTSKDVRRLTVSSTPAVTANVVMRSDVASLGPWYGNRLPILTAESQTFVAMSSYIDHNITYPQNIVVEILAYQLAIDICVKLGKDFAGLKLRLGDPDVHPATGLWGSLLKLSKRDDYEPERVKNSRSMIQGIY